MNARRASAFPRSRMSGAGEGLESVEGGAALTEDSFCVMTCLAVLVASFFFKNVVGRSGNGDSGGVTGGGGGISLGKAFAFADGIG